jgi:DNA-binding CsgD family transcriptional regulator
MAATAEPDLASLFDETDRRLAAVLPFDSSCWITFDPATLLPTSHVTRDALSPDVLAFLARNELCEVDVSKFAELARRTPPVGILSEETGGEPDRSARYRDLLVPHGFEDELRASFVSDGVMWGGVAVHRSCGRFVASEAAAVAALCPHVADAIRRAIVTATAATDSRTDGPGLVIVDEDLAAVATTAAARHWLDEILGPRGDAGELPLVVLGIAERARAGGTARARVPTRSGGWLTVHGSRLEQDPGGLALILEPARAPQIAPLIAEAYGLTDREREVTALVIQGLSTGEIATTLHVSPYTVQDHLKAIFAKFGLRSRRELVAHIFFRHYAPEIERGSTPAADGWFVERGR